MTLTNIIKEYEKTPIEEPKIFGKFEDYLNKFSLLEWLLG